MGYIKVLVWRCGEGEWEGNDKKLPLLGSSVLLTPFLLSFFSMADSPTIHEICSSEEDDYNTSSSGDEEEYEVERIVDHKRLTRVRLYALPFVINAYSFRSQLVQGRFKYLIKWKGYSDEENTWEAEDNM